MRFICQTKWLELSITQLDNVYHKTKVQTLSELVLSKTIIL